MIAQRIREIREQKKISQYAIAYSIGMSQAAYSKIERGETEIKVAHLYQIAAVLKIRIYDLLPPTIENGIISNDYLLKPVFIRLKMLWYRWRVNGRLKAFEKKL
jgi:transcriptional regulator with XRE-family HTH domain